MTDETVAGGSPAAADLDEKVLTEAVRRGLITAVQGAAALEEARAKGVPLHQVLCDRGLVSHDAARDLDEEVREDFVPGYRVLAKLGEGGMGVVYKALQKRLDRVVALKVVIPRLASDPSYLRRFEREAKAAAKLNHPTIVAAYDYGESNGRVFLAMEFVEGVNCADWMRKNGVMPEDRALALVRDVAAGLSHAQAAGIIHRDIKPANLLIADRGPGATTSGTTESGAKVTDLGLARTGDAAASGATELTAAGAILGTPGYMPPEQALGRPVDHRADIYALGSTLYQLMTGQRPFDASTPLGVISRQQTDRLADPRDLLPGISEGAVLLLQGMLSRDARTRYPGYRELLADLERVREGGKPALPLPPVAHRSLAPAGGAAAEPALPTTLSIGAAVDPSSPTVLHGAAPPPPASLPPPARSRTPLVLGAIGLAAVAMLVAFLQMDHGREGAQPAPPSAPPERPSMAPAPAPPPPPPPGAPDPEPAVLLVPDGDPRPLWTGASLGAWVPTGGAWGVSDPERKGWIEGAERPEPAANLRGQSAGLGRARLDFTRWVKDAPGWRLEWQMLGEGRRTGNTVRTEMQFARRGGGGALVLGIDDRDAYLGVRDPAAKDALERTHVRAGVEPGVRHTFVVENHGDVFVATVDGKRLGAVKVPQDLAPGSAIEAAVEGGVGYFSDVFLLRLKRP